MQVEMASLDLRDQSAGWVQSRICILSCLRGQSFVFFSVLRCVAVCDHIYNASWIDHWNIMFMCHWTKVPTLLEHAIAYMQWHSWTDARALHMY